mmetsp:Transcript_24216/g.42566  ORF Transcript_24216/g.42566 Transcript_24216/m.42566 type:complete len:105 (-) Transcript_24216:230-544(-)
MLHHPKKTKGPLTSFRPKTLPLLPGKNRALLERIDLPVGSSQALFFPQSEQSRGCQLRAHRMLQQCHGLPSCANQATGGSFSSSRIFDLLMEHEMIPLSFKATQ